MATENEERFEQILISADADKVAEARKTGILRDVQIMGFESKNGYSYAPEAIAANRSRFEGMSVGVDHDYKLGPLTRENTWGTMRNVSETGRRGDLHFNQKHPVTEEYLHDIEFATRPAALSPVCGKCVEETRDGRRIVTAFEATRLDVVMGAATNKTMFNQAGPETPPGNPRDAEGRPLPPPKVDDTRLEQALAELAAMKDRLKKLETTAPATVATTVARMEQDLTARGIDLTAFHDQFVTGKIK